MENKNLTFSGGLILGAGLMYMLHTERGRGPSIREAAARAIGVSRDALPDGDTLSSSIVRWSPGVQCIAGALGVAAVAFGAKLIAKLGRSESSTSTAFDMDMPNYAWLR